MIIRSLLGNSRVLREIERKNLVDGDIIVCADSGPAFRRVAVPLARLRTAEPGWLKTVIVYRNSLK